MPVLVPDLARATAITDLINGLVLVPMIVSLWGKRADHPLRQRWLHALGALSLACFLGFILHSVPMSRPAFLLCWAALYITFLAALNTFLCLGYHTYTQHPTPFRWLRLVHLAMYLLLISLLLAGKNPIVLFVIYSALLAIPAFFFYGKLAWAGHKGARILLTTVLLQIPGIYIQVRRQLEFTLFWTFDYNSVYHILLLANLVVFYLAARQWETFSHKP